MPIVAAWVPGRGITVSIYSRDSGFNVVLPADWTIAQIERYLKELVEYGESAD